MKCIYHNDPDGRLSAFWVKKLAFKGGRDQPCAWKAIPIDYKDAFPFDEIEQNEAVYIVDFSISPDDMAKLLGITSDVTWIDHHKTAIEAYDGFEGAIAGLRDTRYAGCVLTYVYLTFLKPHPGAKFDPDAVLDQVPLWTMLVGDYDAWRWDYGERTQYFFSGLMMEDTGPDGIWNELLEHDGYQDFRRGPNADSGTTLCVSRIEEAGEIIEKYRKQVASEFIDAWGFESTLDGHSVLVCNQGRPGSHFFGDAVKKYDIVAGFVWDGQQYIVSIYSETVDVSEVAKKFGGGGHKGASGFRSAEMPFRTAPQGGAD